MLDRARLVEGTRVDPERIRVDDAQSVDRDEVVGRFVLLQVERTTRHVDDRLRSIDDRLAHATVGVVAAKRVVGLARSARRPVSW